jgi:hypothetical protein
MVSSAALDVAVVLIMIYLVLSIICSGLSQATTRGARAVWQRGFILNFFSGSSRTSEAGFETALAFYSHPLVQADIYAMPRYGARWFRKEVVYLPAPIPGSRYATALLDLVVDEHRDKPSSLAEGIEHFPNEPLKWLLRALFESVRGDEERFRAELAELFDSGESFIAAGVSRKVRGVQLIWAVAIVALLNVDTVAIVQNVWAQTAEGSDRVRELPVGWGAAEVAFTVRDIASKIAGLLLTVGAITFGSEFWLGLLERLGRAPTSKG